jgi:hypothetical protein
MIAARSDVMPLTSWAMQSPGFASGVSAVVLTKNVAADAAYAIACDAAMAIEMRNHAGAQCKPVPTVRIELRSIARSPKLAAFRQNGRPHPTPRETAPPGAASQNRHVLGQVQDGLFLHIVLGFVQIAD